MSILDDEQDSEKAHVEHAAREGPININKEKTDLLASPPIQSNDVSQVESSLKAEEISGTTAASGQMFTTEGGSLATSSSSPISNILKAKSGTKKVAFVSVKRPAPATTNSLDLHIKEPEKISGDEEDKFYNLLTGGSLKDSLF